MEASFWRSHFPRAGGVLAVVIFFAALMAGYYVPAFNGVDENGYVLSAKRLALRGDLAHRTTDPFEFVSGNHVETAPGVYYAKYPIGYPGLVAAAIKLAGPAAAFWVNPVLATLAVLGMFLLARAFVSELAAVCAAILLATNPLHAYFGLSALSHTGALCCAIWGMYFIWEWAQRGGWWRAALGGAVTAYAVSMRYTEALLALPVLALVVGRRRGGRLTPAAGTRRFWMEVVVMGGAALAALAPLLIQHAVAYGSIFTTGYSLCGEATGFAWRWFKENWWLMLTRMDGGGLLLIFPLGLAGLLALAARARRAAVFLVLWAVPGLLLYAAYYWAPRGEGPGYVRFFVSVFPPLIVGAVAALDGLLRGPRAGPVLLGLFVLLAATANLRQGRELLARQVERLTFAHRTSAMVAESLPADAVIYSSAHVLNFVEFVGAHRLYAQETYDRGAIARSLEVLQDAEPHPFQRQKAQRIANLLGPKNDGQLAQLHRTRLARQVARGRTVALITNQDGFRRWRGRVGDQFRFQPVAWWVDVQSRPARGPRHYAPPAEELRSQDWALYVLQPRADTPGSSEIVALEEKLDATRERLRLLRADYDERYPGAQQQWVQISNLERESKELGEQIRRLKTRTKGAT